MSDAADPVTASGAATGSAGAVTGATSIRYPRVLIKLSGEALAGEKKIGYDFERVSFFCEQIKEVVDLGCCERPAKCLPPVILDEAAEAGVVGEIGGFAHREQATRVARLLRHLGRQRDGDQPAGVALGSAGAQPARTVVARCALACSYTACVAALTAVGR